MFTGSPLGAGRGALDADDGDPTWPRQAPELDAGRPEPFSGRQPGPEVPPPAPGSDNGAFR